ncbi:hypothetical protein RhiirA5_421194 [Rhizophagus irregularis]|uniref:F-box domain-containing protein n=2 Tax=Rhizophagus irregularis TaxID=588596 RepID=A0A2I1DUK6_9GLOM|nr:hypothetical protein RhiirA5_421194 [Rhizophagus irregularis]PKC60607.1 hypothetical protein RhiirA1_467801 [Rhizophagus irregularis]PKY13563.1 hypothetical protein RhiirB3_425402 [Rhizophagus irregularis]CAB5193667.1 unnamed protein product [Rhizophagus irregularis]
MIVLNIDCLLSIFNKLLLTDERRTNKKSLLINKILPQQKSLHKSLHSCLLVNKKWCHLVVPILWKYSFYEYDKKCNNFETKKKLFSVILSCLSSSSKQLLFDNGIKLSSMILLKPLLFNYINFCEFPSNEIVNDIIKSVECKHDKRNLLEQEVYKLFISQCKNIKELHWCTLQPLLSFPGALTCFSQIRSLFININFVNSNDLYEMARFCKNLNVLYIVNYSQNHPAGLISLIDAQRNLKSIILYYNTNVKKNHTELGKALLRKNNTLEYLELGSICLIPPSFLTSFNNLKSITIYNCEKSKDEIKEFQQYLNISEFPGLESLNVHGLSCFKELATLIEKTKGNILQVIIDDVKTVENSGMLIKSISNNCPKIKRLFTYIEPKDFIYIKSLLTNCKNLNEIYLNSLNTFYDNDDNIGDELLNILIEFSPKSLNYIKIDEGWKYSIETYKRFFETNCDKNLTIS